MSKTARFIEGNRLQELPEYERPDLTGAIERNDRRKAACRILPAPDCKFKVGEVYEEGKDYELVWAKLDENYNNVFIAVPIKAEESQDELWLEIVEMFYQKIKPSPDYLKSKFHIERKQ